MPNIINISPGRQKFIVYCSLVTIVLAVFWQLNHFNFINLDDDIYVTENYHVQSGITWSGICWAFSTTYADFWHPLTWLSLILDYQFYGLHPGLFHITNLILHVLSTLLLFWIFNRMTGAVWESAFVAALFAIHPLHVESVARISQRKDVLSVFFGMLTLCLYVYYTEKPAIKRYLPVLFTYLLALMSKPMVVTLPVIMILLDYWPLSRYRLISTLQKSNFILWQLKEKFPFFLLSGLFSVITIYAHYKPTVKEFPLSTHIANAFVSFVTYLVKTFLPYNIAFIYPFPEQFSLWQVTGAVILIIFISLSAITMARYVPHFFTGWLWYMITLLPVLGIIEVGTHAMAGRYHYLPSIGIGIMIAWGVPRLFNNENMRKKILFPVATVYISLMAVLTWQQCGYWENSGTLFEHDLRVTTDNYVAHNHLASYFVEKGNFDKALYHYNQAININPDYFSAFQNRGVAYARQNQYTLALENISEAIRLKPDYAKGYYNRGIVFTKRGLYKKAKDDFDKAISLNPDYADAFIYRAFVLSNIGSDVSVCNDLKNACELGNCIVFHEAKAKGLCH